MKTNSISIIGAGLIGGSIAKCLARSKEFKITCVDKDLENLKWITEDDIDAVEYNSAKEAVSEADLIFICTPVSLVPAVIDRIMPYAKKGAVITDVGSTKDWVINSIRPILPDGIFFIGGHPMAGSEKMGYRNSCADLFKGAVYIITPDDNTPEHITDEMKRIVSIMGACPVIMDKEHHDCSAAEISHLPYVTSVCLSHAVNKADDHTLRISAGSLKDMTRVSASSIAMWRDICLTNKKEIRKTINRFREELDEFARILDEEDINHISDYLFEAKEFRERLSRIKGF